MLLDIVYIIIGIIGLVWGGNWLVTGSARLAESFGIPRLIVGLTIVALGTSSPELLVNLSSVLNGSTDLALGNVVGSNISNIGIILGISGIIAPIVVHATLIRREIPIMIVVAVGMYLLALDGQLNQFDGILLLLGFVAFNGLMIWVTLQNRPLAHVDDVAEFSTQEIRSIKRPIELARLVAGLVILIVGANLTVQGAINIATALGVSELIIGITIVAVGTSLPELMASLIAAIRKESELAIGNVVGSNIFNILLILGTTSAIQPINIPPSALQFDILVMLAFSLLLFPLAWMGNKLDRWECGVLLAGYVVFVLVTIL
ncbi:MAG: calcium/sodium antiporter [Anaerolineae bacterium]|nr:calcium/sodium antiporter [Anaerolineae bacterium]